MKGEPVRCEECGGEVFCVYKYPDGSLDYIECTNCGLNIDWNA